MNLGRVMVIVGLFGVAGLGFTAYQGWRGLDESQIQTHILTGLVPLLISVLAQGWIVFYLVGSRRILVAEYSRRGQPVHPRLGRFGTRALAPILLGLGAALATFVLGASAYAGWTGPGWHAGLFGLATVAQAWAAAASWRALDAVETTLGELEPESAR